MGRIGTIVALLLLPATAGAQVVAQNFSELALKVGPGDRVHAIDRSGREVSGQITDLTPDALVIRQRGGPLRLEQADVVLVRQDRQDPVYNGVLIGASIGVGLGLLATQGGDCHFDSCVQSLVLGTAIWGAGIGILADVLHRTPRDIYRAGPPRSALHVQPLAGRGGGGLRVALSW
jgi:hypothetical protein